MNPVPNKTASQRPKSLRNSESPEPKANRSPVPTWLILSFGLLFYWAQLYVDQHAGEFNSQVYEPFHSYKELTDLAPKDETALLLAKGKVAYDNACKLCHQDSGMGTPGQFPPLAGSEWVVGSPERLIRIPLHGLGGSIKVKGVEWTQSMPAIGAGLPPEDLAAALSYIRQSWGNQAPPIKPEQVKAVSEATAGRSQPWSSQELLGIP
jgi:mono/diheme cytochrome c family protein